MVNLYKNNIKKILFVLLATVFMGEGIFAVDFGVDTQKTAVKFKDVVKFVVKQTVFDDIQKTRTVKAEEEAIIVSVSLQILDLLSQITDELSKKDNKELEKVKNAFWDLCDYVGDIGKPKKHHIRSIEEKVSWLNSLLANKEIVNILGENLVNKIKKFSGLLISLFKNENLNLGGLLAEILDLIYYKPLDVACNNKVTSSIVSCSIVAATAIIFTWLKFKKNKKIKNNVENDELVEIEMQDLSGVNDQANAINDQGKAYSLRNLPKIDYKEYNRTGKKNYKDI